MLGKFIHMYFIKIKTFFDFFFYQKIYLLLQVATPGVSFHYIIKLDSTIIQIINFFLSIHDKICERTSPQVLNNKHTPTNMLVI